MQSEGNEPGHGTADGENAAVGGSSAGHFPGEPVVSRGPLVWLVQRDDFVDAYFLIRFFYVVERVIATFPKYIK